MKLGHSERERKGVYGLGGLWRIVWCMEIGYYNHKPMSAKGRFLILRRFRAGDCDLMIKASALLLPTSIFCNLDLSLSS